MKVEHIGIAVKSLQESAKIYEALFGYGAYKIEEVASESVATLFFRAGETKIELLESTNPEGVIAKYIAKRGEGLHHIAFEVEDIQKEILRLESIGFQVISSTPKHGADNKLVCFLHPKTTGGVLIELCQEIRNE